MTALSHWLGELGSAADEAAAAEQSYRDDFARRVADLAETRAVAFRRANLMRAVAESVARQEDEQAAVAHGLAVLRTRLGWASDSEARQEILSRFAPVCATTFRAADDRDGNAGLLPEAVRLETRIADETTTPAEALATFESWYLGAKGTAFWLLFENVMPETPLVDW